MVVREATRPDVITRGLLWCGVAAGPLFLLTAFAEGATRADYHPLRHPVSSLALGPHGWMQVANFVVTGGLYLSYAVGLWRAPRTVVGTRIGTILIGAVAVGLLGAAGSSPTQSAVTHQERPAHRATTPLLALCTICSRPLRSSDCPPQGSSSATGSERTATAAGRSTQLAQQ
jgi:hypothetical protein